MIIHLRKLRRLLYIFFAAISIECAHSQVTTEGKEFWLAFMENEDNGGASEVNLEIYLSAKERSTVNISAPLTNFSLSVEVLPGISQIIQIPTEEFMPTTVGRSNIGMRVTSDNPISVYALNKRVASADAAVILPLNALGKEYYVTAHLEPEGDRSTFTRESQMLILAVQDDTEVEITPSVPIGNLSANVPFRVTLDAGEVYFLKSANFDITGTLVKSVSSNSDDCKNIAVFGGNVFTNVGGCGDARDHLFEQMFPISTWGKNFLYVPYATRQGGDYVKIIASKDNTEINITGEETITLNAGEYYINKALPGIRKVTANEPISFAQFSRSQACDNTFSDPFYILVSPLEQRIKEVTFNAFTVEAIDRYYLTLITDANSTNNILLDGVSISNQFITFEDAAYASISISRGDHTIEAEGGVIAYVYGYGNFESFGYSAGVALENLNLQVQGDDEFISIIQDRACLNAEIDFTVEFITPPGETPRFNTFEWDFGNGDLAQGQSVIYTYTTPGEYQLTLVASDGLGSCGTSETVIKTITIEETLVDGIVGASSVCPDVNGIEYSISGGAGNTYEWLIEGGTIASNSGDRIVVNWGAANPDAFLKVVPRNSLGCRIDTINYPVVINKRLEPAAPFTESAVSVDGLSAEVCFDDRRRVRYFVSPTNGSNYTWQVQGGTFTADSNPTSTEVFVDWGNSTSGRIWYVEANDLIDDCEGVSDVLEVTIYSPIVAVPTISDVLCYGESTGAISLAISGGKPGDYQVSWSNGMTGVSIMGLPIGDYIATITDGIGCSTQATYTVGQPEELLIQDIAVLPVRCFQERNGEAEVFVTGGVTFGNGNYQFTWELDGIQTVTNNHVNNGLAAGSYKVTVTDANGCQTSGNFVIAEPPLLEVDLEAIINEPICPQATNGIAFVDAKGGTPDYQFYWSNKPTVDDNNGTDLSQGSYSVRIVDANDCEITYSLDIVERFPKIFIPNAFSPNNDGTNDTFKPVTDCQLTFFMQVYNKWGSIVFSTEDITKGWDGSFQGEIAPQGEYSYVVFYAGTLNNLSFEETYRGSFKLIR